MRILHTIDSAGLYGAESVLLDLAGAHRQQGLEPTILSIGNLQTTSKAIELESAKRGINYFPLRMKDGLNFAGAVQILDFAQKHHIDVIHSHGYKSNVLLATAPKSTKRRPIVTTLHGWTARKPLSKLGLYKLIDQVLLPRFDAVVLVTAQMRLLRAIRRLNPNKVHTIWNGISTDLPSAAEFEAIRIDPIGLNLQRLKQNVRIVVGAVGRLSPEKNFAGLIEAIHELTLAGHSVGAMILGDGPEAAHLRQLISDRNLNDRVLLGGYVTNARRYFGLFDMLVMPSLTEGLPITLLEAMSASLPIIATQVGEIEGVLDGLGIVIPAGNSPKLMAAMDKMIRDFEHYKRDAVRGPVRVFDSYSVANMAKQYEKVYQAIC